MAGRAALGFEAVQVVRRVRLEDDGLVEAAVLESETIRGAGRLVDRGRTEDVHRRVEEFEGVHPDVPET